jgi:hypothetical protein
MEEKLHSQEKAPYPRENIEEDQCKTGNSGVISKA